MTGWNARIAEGYDRVAEAYAARFGDELDRKPDDRELLDHFAAVTADGVIADVGCGPGHVARYLRARGWDVVGVDLSPVMLAVGRSTDLGPRFVVGSFYDLPLASGALAGAIAFYSLIHATRSDVTDALRELKRVIRAAGTLLIAVHEGAGETHADEFLGAQVDIDATFYGRDELAGYVADAGFEIVAAHVREPYDGEVTRRLYVTARA